MNILQFHSEEKVPVILQNESSECGLCCVLMIASFYGYESSLSTERQKNMMPSHGMNLFDLMKVSESMNLIGRGLRVDINNLQSLKVPCILHWNMNHFVVLKSVKKDHVIIHDPSTGIVKLTFEQVSDSFTGIALELTPSSKFIQKKEVKRLRISQLWNNSVGIKKALIQIITLSVILQFFATISPFYIQLVIDCVIIDNNFELLIMLALSFSAFLIFNVITEYVRSIFMLRLTSTLNVSMSMNVFRHLLRLPLSYFENRHVGDIVSRFNSLGEIRKAISSGVAGIVIDAFMSIITLVMMAIYNIPLTLTAITIILLYIALRVLMYSKMRQLTNDSIHTHALENSSFMESLRTIQSIKIFGKENHRQNAWSNKYIKSVNADISIQKYQIVFLIFNRLIFGLGNIIVIYIAARFIISGELSLGMLYAFISYKDQFVTRMGSFIDNAVELKMVSVHLERLSDVVFTSIEGNIINYDNNEQRFEGDIEVKGISFRHSDFEGYIFTDLSFHVKPGESVVIVGPSGRGKTTLLKCIMGLLKTSTGQILSNGIEISKLPNFRTKIAAVMQDDSLFTGSIIENITFFDSDFDMSWVITCAKTAAIHDDIEAMPMGYHSLIGDMGTVFSGGQKQRILLARALYVKPRILFLDEATSSLDSELEHIVNSNIKSLNITRISIAHRGDTIRSADRVIELK